MAAKELEKKTNILEEIECKVQIQKGIVEKERKSLDAVRLRVQEVCQKCYLPPRLDVFTEAEESLTEYKEELMKVQISYGIIGMESVMQRCRRNIWKELTPIWMISATI